MNANHEAYRMLTVYVPAPTAPIRYTIATRSGIVGTPKDDGQVRIDYEGNLHGASNIVTFADRVAQAAGRHTTNYPTIARAWVPSTNLVPVGRWDDTDGIVTVDNYEALAAWLHIETIPDGELLASGARYEHRRALVDALRSPDPAVRRFAAQEAKRLDLDL